MQQDWLKTGSQAIALVDIRLLPTNGAAVAIPKGAIVDVEQVLHLRTLTLVYVSAKRLRTGWYEVRATDLRQLTLVDQIARLGDSA